MHFNLAPYTRHEDNMYECSIHCYTQAECEHVLPPTRHPVRPQAEEMTVALADITWIGVVGTGTAGAGIAEAFAKAGYEVL
jgi:hypothetical protein